MIPVSSDMPNGPLSGLFGNVRSKESLAVRFFSPLQEDAGGLARKVGGPRRRSKVAAAVVVV